MKKPSANIQYCSLAFKKGFTLLELMIVLVIVGVLATVGMSSYQSFVLRAQLSETATQLGFFAREFKTWEKVNGRFPNDSHIALPPDANGLAINPIDWSTPTLLGGNWNWEGPDRYSYAGISIDGATAEEEDIILLDTIMDNGDLNTGEFRKTGNGRYTFIISE